MIDSARALREMYKDYVNCGCPIYDGRAPGEAGLTMPYAVITSIDTVPIAVRPPFQYNATVNIEIFDEFRENGGTASQDAIANAILEILVRRKQYASNQPPVDGFTLIYSYMESYTNMSDEYIGSVRVFKKRLAIRHHLIEN